ncbi:MAG: hypothetical protein DWQ19_10765 [Crenarchaeota archaeon]|nr:MAG: hypothetical protein DWQ19_10765 [Thermoproteota archaeon]
MSKKLDNLSDEIVSFWWPCPSYYRAQIVYGVFSGKYVNWNSCRESFHTLVDSNTKRFLIKHSTKTTPRDIAAFIGRIERKLGIKPNSMTTFCITNETRTICVYPSSFWTRHGMRFSLFTILLRAAKKYKCSKRNYRETLESNAYIKRTKKAVDRFLQGNTKCNTTQHSYAYSGWLSTFSRNQLDLNKMLKKP